MVTERPDWWRQRVRLDWVRAEIALLDGDPAGAITASAAAIQRAEVSGAPRHVAKGLLFLGVAQVQAGSCGGRRHAASGGHPRREPGRAAAAVARSRAVLGALLEETDPPAAAKALSSARGAVIAVADDLPEDLRAVWLDRPDVAALLGG